ncbi:hypothetical protein GCM10017044_26640 [Kordiimonas sediminis]|uniref:PAS domain-containing protein n=1 Tax=Kordiimonas sediminis TaxID=1735581 RepID=A0A919AWL7_9PROT|nr:PAS domain-containing protein [Kordiimonas sediminis]GHF29986.1 hypothetical protein GCM10017044_26640 [Kordiimonas sediminis]
MSPNKQAPENIFEIIRGVYNTLPRVAGSILPHKRDLNPAAIKSCLPYILLAEHIGGGDLRYRLAGTHTTEIVGHEITGKTFNDLGFTNQTIKKHKCSLFEKMFRHPCGLYSKRRLPHDNGTTWEYHALYLPMHHDAKDPDMALIATKLVAVDHDENLSLVGKFRFYDVELIETDFIDLGAGTPDDMPYTHSMVPAE